MLRIDHGGCSIALGIHSRSQSLRGPRGKGHNKEKNALPLDLLREFTDCALSELPQRRTKRRRVIVDLCSGYQSWKPVASENDCIYVAMDVLGDRNVRRCAAVHRLT